MEAAKEPGHETESQRYWQGNPHRILYDRADGIALSRDEAWEIVGGLSRTRKMPCHSWGLPATSCKTGTVLARMEGTVCHGCYARKHAYLWPRTRRANERRLAKAEHPAWVEAMSTLVEWQARRNRCGFFRWLDTGDLQSTTMLERIVEVANVTPGVQHWLPTKEYALVRQYLAAAQLPDNLTIRASALFVDGEPPQLGLPTSTVHRNEPPIGVACPAYDQHPPRCGPCRTCWDPGVPNVSYPHH